MDANITILVVIGLFVLIVVVVVLVYRSRSRINIKAPLRPGIAACVKTTAAWITALDGFFIENGSAHGIEPNDRGAGMFIETDDPNLRNIKFEGNSAENGAGLYAHNSNVELRKVTFFENNSSFWGGGAHFGNSTPRIINSTFVRNTAGYGGGGINFDGCSATMVNANFYGNNAGGNGGGFNSFQGTISITNSVFAGNLVVGNFGGGAFAQLTNLSFTNITFFANTATQKGGGFYNLDGPAAVINSIFWGNTAGSDGQVFSNNVLPVSYSLIEGGYNGTGNLSSSPYIIRNPDPGSDVTWDTVDDDYGNLRLNASSPAIDKGNISLLPQDEMDLDQDGNTAEKIPFDLDWNARISVNKVDIGEYEFQYVLVYIPSIMK